ncbi:MAG: tetraether lipid synthase Tes [Candidatus Hydrothermarchaeaceae archaeon]
MREIKTTMSLCPECQKILSAKIFEDNGKVWIAKKCPEHGEVEELYWSDYELYKWASRFNHDGKGIKNPNVDKEKVECPFDCGLCKKHISHTGLANIVLTNRCNLKCWYCFFYAREGDNIYEPTLEQVRQMLRNLKNEKPVGANAVQYTGGEPTLRDDLIDIIRLTREEGFDHIQLNTNGIKLAKDPEYTEKIRQAGVNTVYMSFDGVTPKTNPKNHYHALKAIESCRKANMGVVLVPTVIKGKNDHELWDIVKFGLDNIDVVRGINFQPVSLVGRMPRKERDKFRITIPDVIKKLKEQSNGMICEGDFLTIPCIIPTTHFVEALTKRAQYELSNHFACGMATYVFKEGDRIIPITRFVDVEGLMEYLEEKAEELRSGKNKYWVGLKVLYEMRSFVDEKKQPRYFNLAKILYNALMKHNYETIGAFHKHAMLLGMMHFMDLYNYDLERVKRCDIHYATPDGRIIPFCAFNVLPEIYRDRIQSEYSVPAREWERYMVTEHHLRKVGEEP